MKKKSSIINKIIFFTIIILIFLSGCGVGTPEQQAQKLYDHSQRFDAEMARLEQGLPEQETGNSFFGYIIVLVIGLVSGWGFSTAYNNTNKPDHKSMGKIKND